MSNLTNYKYFLLAGIILLAICCLSYIGIITVREISHEIAIQRVSRNLGIDPSYRSLTAYIFDHLERGMSKEKVFQELEKIGPYTVGPGISDECEVVDIKPGILNITSLSLTLCYDTYARESLDYVSIYDW